MDDPKSLTLLIPIALGLAGHFGLFIDTRAVFRGRVHEVHSSLKENLAQFLAELLEHVNVIQDEPLREPLLRPGIRGGGSGPDRVMRYTSETWRTLDLLSKVARASFCYKFGQYVLFSATWIGVALLIVSIAFPSYSSHLLVPGLVVIGIQGLALIELFFICNAFEKYERAT